MALQRKNEPGGRQIIYQIRLSEQEQKALQVRANARGMKVSRYMIESALAKDDDAHQAVIWRNELIALRRLVAENGYSAEIHTKILDLLRKLEG